MSQKKLVLITGALLLIATFSCAQSQPSTQQFGPPPPYGAPQYGPPQYGPPRYGPRPIFLGDSYVDYRQDHDTIRIGRQAGPFSGIQLRANGGAVDVQRVVVRYANGGQEMLRAGYRIQPGGQSRILAFSGYQRPIRSVELWYSKPDRRSQPRVSLYGIR